MARLIVESTISNIQALDKVINAVGKFQNKEFNDFILKKSLETLNEVINQRSSMFDTDNDHYLYEYKMNNKVERTDKGFIIYNDTEIDLDPEYVSPKTIANYPSGKFNIAMAFEYGTGIVGLTSPVDGHWEYNVNDHNEGWIYKDPMGTHITFGSRGYEFYRFTAIEINKRLSGWTKEFFERGGK